MVNIFETSQVRGDYSMVTLLKGDTGHLTFGRSQTTLGSGNLFKLLQLYCSNHGAKFAARIERYLARVEVRDLALDTDQKLHNLLRATADDPVMRDTQDLFFDQVYWQPAARAAERLGIQSALGVAVVYDSYVHGSWGTIRDRTNQQKGTIENLGEKAWLQSYVSERRDWLTNSPRPDLRATVYRMEAFQRLMSQGFWGLELPLVVCGAEISPVSLTANPPGCFDGPQPGSRLLSLQSPLLRGLDVRLLQLGLSDSGTDIKADGIFGQASVKCVREYQAATGLPATGAADISLVARLAVV
jgi:chitosanase